MWAQENIQKPYTSNFSLCLQFTHSIHFLHHWFAFTYSALQHIILILCALSSEYHAYHYIHHTFLYTFFFARIPTYEIKCSYNLDWNRVCTRVEEEEREKKVYFVVEQSREMQTQVWRQDFFASLQVCQRGDHISSVKVSEYVAFEETMDNRREHRHFFPLSLLLFFCITLLTTKKK